MGFQSQEQRKFDGLFTSAEGTLAPRWSAKDSINIDGQFRSIKGREPSERVSTALLPEPALYFNGISSYAHTASSEWGTLDDGDGEWAIGIYLTGLDPTHLTKKDDNTRYCILNLYETGNTDITAPGATGGLNLYLEIQSGEVDLVCKTHYDSTGAESISITSLCGDTDAALTSKNVRYYIIVSDDGDSGFRMNLIDLDDSNAGTRERLATAAAGAKVVRTLSDVYVGAFREGGTPIFTNHLEGVVGGVYLYQGLESRAAAIAREGLDEFRGNRSSLSSVSIPLHEGYGWQANAIDSGDADDLVNLYPRPPEDSSGILINKGNWGRLDLSGLNTTSTHVWLIILEVNIPRQDLSSIPFLARTADGNAFITVQEIDSTTYDITCKVALESAAGLLGFEASVSSDAAGGNSPLSYDSTYRIAVQLHTNPGAGPAEVDLNMYWSLGSGWGTTGEDADSGVVGIPTVSHDWLFGADIRQERWMNYTLKGVHFFNELPYSGIISTAGSVAIYDAYPGDGGFFWPVALAASFDESSGLITSTEGNNAEDTAQGNAWVTSWKDNFTGDYTVEFYPKWGPSCWGAMSINKQGAVTNAKKLSLNAVSPSVETRGGKTTRYLNYLVAGGVYRFDEDAETGEWLQHKIFSGRPSYGVVSDSIKDRHYMCGPNMGPLKVFPSGVGKIGLPVPGINMELSAAGHVDSEGELTSSGEYRYKATFYNSATGQESNISDKFEYFVLAHPADNALELKIDSMTVPNGYEDWDTFRFYRTIHQGTTFYLEGEVPKPGHLPDGDADGSNDVLFFSTMSDVNLVLQASPPTGNEPPPDFTCMGVSNRTLHIGGNPLRPGWAYYSKILFMESFPPTNVWQLDDDHSNSVKAIVPLFGRLIIFKQRSIWGCPDNAAETGQEPVQLHSDRGLVAETAWAQADNTVFFVSPDRSIYITDGMEIQDISSPTIKKTLFDLTEAQLTKIQAVHDGRGKSVWFGIPNASTWKGDDRLVLCYRYDVGRWQKYEMPFDSLANGHDTDTAGEYGGFAYKGNLYRLRDGDTNKEGDYAGSQSTFVYDYYGDAADESIVTDGGDDGYCIAAASETLAWQADLEGLPCIVVPHTTAYDSSDPEAYHPLWDEPEASRIYTYVQGTETSGSDEYIHFGTPFDIGANTRLWVGVGMQYRRYLSQWITPQGEDRPAKLFGGTFVHHPEHTTSNTNPRFRYHFDYEATTDGGWLQKSAAPRFPDTNHEKRRRCRRFGYEIVEGLTRGDKFEITRVAWRFRTRGPRRKR